jgi:hypothetical protein
LVYKINDLNVFLVCEMIYSLKIQKKFLEMKNYLPSSECAFARCPAARAPISDNSPAKTAAPAISANLTAFSAPAHPSISRHSL